MKFFTPKHCMLATALTTVFTVGALAQEPKSAGPAKELAQLLATKKLESIAARMPDSREEFVGALTFPGQLMVVWAKTTAPSVVNEKLIKKEYREVYIDLNSASVVESRHFVTDLGLDGLRAKPEQKQGPADSHDSGSKTMRFDGSWRDHKMSEADYMKAHSEADAAYAKAIQALIDEIKKAG
ncbi:MAG TPA: hypothetical protein VM096_05115 [Vicinamibacterales bacterium]|nr:hypothetical protein [Vicinamibacterales bacterium]